jgi:hypothetical protein
MWYEFLKLYISVTGVHEIGSRCEYNEECSNNLGKAECINNQCQCVQGTSWNKDDGTCGKVYVSRTFLCTSANVLRSVHHKSQVTEI